LTFLYNIEDLDENFLIGAVKVNTYLEQHLFYSFDKKQWTLNEMLFFAENNLMLVSIYDEANNLLIEYDYRNISGFLKDDLGNFLLDDLGNYIVIDAAFVTDQPLLIDEDGDFIVTNEGEFINTI